MAVDSREQWDATNYAAKDNLLRVVREQAEGFFELANKPENWESPTTSGHWQVRDIAGHLVDTTEGYLARFETTRGGAAADPIAPLDAMAKTADQRAMAYRGTPQDELMTRLRDDFASAMKMFEEVNEQDWGGMMITHAYMGPVPAFFYPIGQLMDYGVHGWDVREGLGMPNFLDSDVADFLVPFMFIVWQATTDPTRLHGGDLDVAVRVSGRNSGTWRFRCNKEGMTYEPGEAESAPAVIEFDPSSLVLTAFGRVRSGTPYGDMNEARRFASLFFSI